MTLARRFKPHHYFLTSKIFFSALFLYSVLSVSTLCAESDEDGLIESQSEYIFLAVDKSKLVAELKTLPEPGRKEQLLHTFRIAVGKEIGDKVKEGDNKTPEGIYLSKKHISSDRLLQSKYGKSAIPLNFPNPIDRLEGKTGYGIWLHGAGNDERIADATVTEGCVAFYNADILKLSKWLKPAQSIVVIAKNLEEVNLKEDVNSIYELTQQWVEAWQERDIESYIKNYSDEFVNSGKTKKAYKRYKSNVFRSYKKMEVNIDSLHVVTHPKYAISFMNQDFRGDNRFTSVGRKILYWKKEGTGWKIMNEYFDREQFNRHSFNLADVRKLGEMNRN